MKIMVNLITVVMMIFGIICNPVKGNYEEEINYLIDASMEEAEMMGYEDPKITATHVNGPRYYIEESFIDDEGEYFEVHFIVDVTNYDDITLIYAEYCDEFQYDFDGFNDPDRVW